jgi:hypothetical protein
MCIPIARQRLRKHASTIERLFYTWFAPRPLLCNGVLNKPKTIWDNRRRRFPRGPCEVVVKKNSIEQHREKNWVSRRQPARIWAWNWTESSLRNWQLQSNNKKEIRWRKEDFMYDLKWQWDCYKSVAKIRLAKTENPGECVTVNGKVCSLSDDAVLPVVPNCVNKVSINPIIQSKAWFLHHAQPLYVTLQSSLRVRGRQLMQKQLNITNHYAFCKFLPFNHVETEDQGRLYTVWQLSSRTDAIKQTHKKNIYQYHHRLPHNVYIAHTSNRMPEKTFLPVSPSVLSSQSTGSMKQLRISFLSSQFLIREYRKFNKR